MSLNLKKIRADFPILTEKIRGKPPIYFDNACMSLKPKQVIEATDEYYYKYTACAGRSHHKLGEEVTNRYERSRATIAKFVGARRPEEIIFTRNTTEGLNLVINSLGLRKGDVVITTDKEHNSMLLPIQRLTKERGVRHEIIFSKADGFDLDQFKEKMAKLKNVKLVAMVHTSNLDGSTIPAREIVKIAHDNGALVLLDGAQSVPHKEINVKKLDVDFLAWSGHKMMGPTGTGALYGKINLLEKLQPFLLGGDTVIDTTYTSYTPEKVPHRFEAGLQNYAGAIGFAAACDYLKKIGRNNIEKHEYMLNKIATDKLAELKEVTILGPQDPKLRSGIISFLVKGISVHDVALMLDETANVMIRSGAHCVHSWFNAHKLHGSDRASLYLYNTKEEVKIFAGALKKVIEFFK